MLLAFGNLLLSLALQDHVNLLELLQIRQHLKTDSTIKVCNEI